MTPPATAEIDPGSHRSGQIAVVRVRGASAGDQSHGLMRVSIGRTTLSNRWTEKTKKFAKLLQWAFGDTKFRLTGVREPWNGLSYDELDVDDQLRLDDSVIHTIIFNQEKPRDEVDSIHFVFERINSGGIRLSPQEIRNCISFGPFTDLTINLNKDIYWRKLYGKESTRSKDQELIVRVLSLLKRGAHYERPMATFLTKFSEDMNNIDQKDLEKLEFQFREAAKLSLEALGETAFRPVRALNAAVLDAFMAALAEQLEVADEKPDDIHSHIHCRMKFDWDAGNHAKCQKLGLTIPEIEYAMRNAPRVAPDPKHSGAEQRFVAIGRTQTARHVFVPFCWRGDRLRPISARYMHAREIEAYETAQSAEDDDGR